MEGANNRSLPEESGSKRPSTKIFAIALVAILIMAAFAGVVFLMGVGAGKTTATATADKVIATVGETVNFTAATSTSAGKITNYAWNFGDGTIEEKTIASASHEYANAGMYTIILTIMDDKGNSATNWGSLLTIEVSLPEAIEPTNGSSPIPLAVASSTALKATNSTIILNANASLAWDVIDGDPFIDVGNVMSFSWHFGDGSADVTGDPSVAGAVTHTYAGDGSVIVSYVAVTSIHDVSAKYYITVVVYPANYDPSAAVKHPDTFVLATVGQPQCIDPAVDYESAGGEILNNVYETLVWYNANSSSELKPMLATEVPTVENGGISEDKLNYTFHIRQNCQVPRWRPDDRRGRPILYRKGPKNKRPQWSGMDPAAGPYPQLRHG